MVIIKYYEWLRLNKDPDRYPIWEICNEKYEKVKEISKEEAKKLIQKHNLQLAYFDNNGAIYEK